MKITKKRALAAATTLAAVGAVMTGAAVTSAAIENPAADDDVVSVEQVAQDADGGWYACAIDDVAWDEMPSTAMPAPAAATEIGDGLGVWTAVGVVEGEDGLPELPVEFGELVEGVEVIAGELPGIAIALPGPDEIRPGTDEECATLAELSFEDGAGLGELVESGTVTVGEPIPAD